MYSLNDINFRCEEEIIKQSQKNGMNYIILRLPDVLGQRDSTNRFWSYQMWLQYLAHCYPNSKLDIFIPKKYIELKTSYVYVKDVARTVNQLLHSNIKNEIFNIGIFIFIRLDFKLEKI
jgi:nucleoside-diphosphate-sugar epimerase